MCKMSYDSTLSLDYLIRTPIFVEDEEAKIYLGTLLSNSVQYTFEIASGVCGVMSRIQDFMRRHPKTMAFGIRDRDYDEDDSGNWQKTNRRCFALQRHEVENYCIDPQAIAGYLKEFKGISVDVDDISRFAYEYSKGIVFAVAYNSYMSELERDICRSCLKHVRIYSKSYDQLTENEKSHTIVTEQDALLSLSKFAAKDYHDIDVKFSQKLEMTKDCLSSVDGDWIKLFPGKEIVMAVWLKFVGNKDFDIGLVKYIAETQLKKDAMPTDIKALFDIIKQKSNTPADI